MHSSFTVRHTRMLVFNIQRIFSQACTVFSNFGIIIPLCLLIDVCFIIGMTQHLNTLHSFLF
jgi:hypothetical protein